MLSYDVIVYKQPFFLAVLQFPAFLAKYTSRKNVENMASCKPASKKTAVLAELNCTDSELCT